MQMTEVQYVRSRWFEDIPVGEFHVFGTHTFSERDILDFSSRYGSDHSQSADTPRTARIHRNIIASEWHVVAIWMRLMVAYMNRLTTHINDGRRNGAGVCIANLGWLEPVRPGHTLTYTYEITAKKPKLIRNKWSIIRSHNEAINQYGECVLTFDVDILAERNPAGLSPP